MRQHDIVDYVAAFLSQVDKNMGERFIGQFREPIYQEPTIWHGLYFMNAFYDLTSLDRETLYLTADLQKSNRQRILVAGRLVPIEKINEAEKHCKYWRDDNCLFCEMIEEIIDPLLNSPLILPEKFYMFNLRGVDKLIEDVVLALPGAK